MTTMIAEVYDAFTSIGINKEKAQAAAIALSKETKSEFQEIKTDFKNDIQEIKFRTQKVEKDIQKIDCRVQKIEKELAVLKWMVGGVFALCVTILAKLFIG